MLQVAAIGVMLAAGVKGATIGPETKPVPKKAKAHPTPSDGLLIHAVKHKVILRPVRRQSINTRGDNYLRFKRSQEIVNGLSDGVPPVSVKNCESGGNYQAENPSSSASGAWQITNGTFRTTKPGQMKDSKDNYIYPTAASAPPEVQDKAAAELWNGGKGRGHWKACL